MVSWIEYTKQNLPFNCNNRAHDKTKVHKAPINKGKDAQVRRVASYYLSKSSLIKTTCS